MERGGLGSAAGTVEVAPPPPQEIPEFSLFFFLRSLPPTKKILSNLDKDDAAESEDKDEDEDEDEDSEWSPGEDEGGRVRHLVPNVPRREDDEEEEENPFFSYDKEDKGKEDEWSYQTEESEDEDEEEEESATKSATAAKKNKDKMRTTSETSKGGGEGFHQSPTCQEVDVGSREEEGDEDIKDEILSQEGSGI